jgi:hypothetical protein
MGDYLAKIKGLVAEHTPELHIHPEESFLPCSAEWFVENCALWVQEPAPVKKVRLLCTPFLDSFLFVSSWLSIVPVP